jgi:hypothetical protein
MPLVVLAGLQELVHLEVGQVVLVVLEMLVILETLALVDMEEPLEEQVIQVIQAIMGLLVILVVLVILDFVPTQAGVVEQPQLYGVEKSGLMVIRGTQDPLALAQQPEDLAEPHLVLGLVKQDLQVILAMQDQREQEPHQVIQGIRAVRVIQADPAEQVEVLRQLAITV